MEVQVKYKTEQGDAPSPPIDTGGATSSATDRKLEFQKRIRASNLAIQNADFHCAIQLYTEAMTLDPGNHILHSNRSAAFMKTNQYEKALEDAREARRLQPKWPKAYFREGVALQCLARETEAMASFAAGLAEDPKSPQLLHGLVEMALQSSLKDEFMPLHAQLQRMKLDQSPFVIISVIGQSLLARSQYAGALVLLESALRIGTCSLKLRGSVFSSLSSAHWGVGNINKAIACMQQDLAIVKSLGDAEGECRAHGNLGAAYFSKGGYREALQHHRSQLVLTMRLKDRKGAATTLSHLGHVYTAVGDYGNALSSHKQCVLLLKQSKNRLLEEAREIGNVGAVYLAMGDFSSALECHNEHLKLAKRLGNKVEEARAFSNIGSAYHYRRDFEKAIAFHNHVLNIAVELSDRTLEARAYAGLGHASRCMSDLSRAKYYHEKQLDNSLVTRDKVAEGRSCSNLGIVYHQFGDFDAALKLHKAHLRIAKELGDRASQGRAYGNIGNAYSALGQYELAVRFHKQELEISKEVNDKHSESSTHGNLAVAYQWLQNYDKALQHYATHLQMAKELHDTPSESRALNNLGNFHSLRKHYAQAIPYYEQYLVLSQELGDAEGEGKVCHRLGYAHYCIGNYKEAVRYYEQDLVLARDADNQGSIARAYCNLGLAHKALGDLRQALDCQRQCLAIARQTDNLTAKFNALGNIGDVLVKLAEVDEALAMFNEQVQMARTSGERRLEAIAYANLGATYRLVGQHDKALAFHMRELAICQERGDVKAECRAHGNIGNVHMSLGNYGDALRSYSAQLERAHELKDSAIEAHAYANLGLTKMNMGQFEEAIGFFEQQLALFEQVSGSLADRGRAFGNLADCYEALSDYEEAVKCYERHLAIAQSGADKLGQMRAYRGLGNAHRAMGNLQQALVCFEKRLVIAHDIDKADAKSSAYGELGCLHSLLGNFEQAILCLQHQVAIAREKGDKVGEGEAVCGLGGVYQHMGEFDQALEHHQLDLHIALETDSAICQCRAYGNIGLAYESTGNFEKALEYQQQHLTIATHTNDRAAVTLAYSSLGRVNHALGNYEKSVEYLQQGLLTAAQLGHQEDEAKIRQRLGLALWGQHNLEAAREQLYRATELFETIRRDAPYNNDYKLSLFDLQTASYQALQRVLVALGHHDDALVVAERGRTRAFVDLLLERQLVDGADSWYNSLDSSPVTLEQILGHVRQQRATVVYYSLAAGYLYSWVISPDHGITKFHQYSINEFETSGSDPEDTQSMKSFRSSLSASGTSVLDGYVGHVREALGIESHLSTSRASLYRSSSTVSETESEADDLWQHHLEEIGDKLNAENDRTGFLRMVNRSHVWNSSTYSLSSMLSGSTSVTGSFVPSRAPSKLSGKPPLSALYELLIAPLEDVLPSSSDACKELVLVLQGDLYLVPFALLKGSQAAPCLFERFSLLVVPSIRALETNQVISKHSRYNPNCTGAVVIGNPKLPSSLTTRWQWGSLPGAEQECKVVAEMLGCRMITGSMATKTKVIAQIEHAEVLHFATHISWKLAAIVVSPGNDFSSPSSTVMHGNFERMDLNGGDLDTSFDTPPLSDFLLTAADILNMKISAKLVVLSSGHSDDRAGRINTDGVVGLTRAFLATGAQCILFSLWPLPDGATRIFIKVFYTSLLQGVRPSHALSGAMKAVQNSRQFSHPANWAGWVLIGSDVQLSSQVALMAHSLCQLLRTPTKSREAMRVVLHLVEKSLQRIRNGQRNPMYTTQHSIEKKVGPVTGWRDLLTAVGFRLEPAYNGLPPAVFFPTSDPADRLMQCSASLQALFGLGVPTLIAFSKMLDQQEVGEAMTALIRDVNAKSTHDSNPQTQVNVRLWGAPGCHEFLASLGFDLVDVGRDEVTIKAGKQANKRTLTFALQALVAVFDTQQAPRSLQLDNSSSMESLMSSGSNTSTSNFSKGSSPVTSPSVVKRRSFFNPAEVDRLPSATCLHKHTRRQPGEPRSQPDISLQLSRQTLIRNKYSSPSASDLSDTNAHDSSTDTMPRPRLTVLNSSSRSRHSGGKPSFPVGPPPPNIYSTSDSEDASEFVLSRAPSRSSFASQASTVTLKSVSGMRRNRIRSSVTSTRSSASDRTITNEFLNLSDDLSPADSTGGRLSDSKHADPTRNDCASRLDDQSRNPVRHTTPDRHRKTASNSKLHTIADDSSTAMLDPTYVAQKILAETRPQRQALELMQKWSVDQLHLKRMTATQNDSCKQDDSQCDIYDRYPGLCDTDDKQTKDWTSLGGSTCATSPTVGAVDQRTEKKPKGGLEVTKPDATYANIPPVACSAQPEQRRAFHRVESGTRNTPGQNTAFRGCSAASSDDSSRSSRVGSDHGSSSTPWLGKPSALAVRQMTESRPQEQSGWTDASKYTHTTFSRPLPVVAAKPFTASPAVNMAQPIWSPQTQHGSQTKQNDSHKEPCQPESWKDLTASKKTTEPVLPPDGQTSARDADSSVDVKCPSALKSVHRPNKQKTVKFQDEIKTNSPIMDERQIKQESCDGKKLGSVAVCNGLGETITPQTQSPERGGTDLGKTSQIPPVMYKPPPPYPGPGRKLRPPQRAPPSGPVNQIDRPGAAVSNGYRDANEYNDRVSATNGYTDHCPGRRGCSDTSSPGVVSVDDDMTDLNSRQNLKRMSMHMYTSSDDSTASAAHRLNGVTQKRVTENFQRFQAHTCNGDAVPNPIFTSQLPLASKQNGAPNFVANYIESGDTKRQDGRRDYDWECRTRVPVSRTEEATDRTRHSRDPFTLQSSQC